MASRQENQMNIMVDEIQDILRRLHPKNSELINESFAALRLKLRAAEGDGRGESWTAQRREEHGKRIREAAISRAQTMHFRVSIYRVDTDDQLAEFEVNSLGEVAILLGIKVESAKVLLSKNGWLIKNKRVRGLHIDVNRIYGVLDKKDSVPVTEDTVFEFLYKKFKVPIKEIRKLMAMPSGRGRPVSVREEELRLHKSEGSTRGMY